MIVINIFRTFQRDNIKKKGIEYIINNYENIIIDKINENGKKEDFKARDVIDTLNLNDDFLFWYKWL